MSVTIHGLTVVAILATAVVFGTDVFCAIVQRPALAQVDDDTLTAVMGRIHYFGDRRMPIPGITGLVAAVVAAALAVVTGRPAPAALATAAVLTLITWLGIYAKASAPVNKQLTAAATHHRPLPAARSLQHAWDSVITMRAVLQGVALAALCIALAL